MAETMKAADMAEMKQIPTVALGGRLWEMRFGHKAMRRYCAATRCNMATFDRSLVYYENVIKLLWCILTVQDETVTETQLDDWLDELLLEDVMEMVGATVEAAMPKSTAKASLEEEQTAAEGTAGSEEENPTEKTT